MIPLTHSADLMLWVIMVKRDDKIHGAFSPIYLSSQQTVQTSITSHICVMCTLLKLPARESEAATSGSRRRSLIVLDYAATVPQDYGFIPETAADAMPCAFHSTCSAHDR